MPLVPPPDRPVARWHVAPWVDICAYGFSWIWVLIPIAMLPDPRTDWMWWFVFIMIATDVHRHYGLPYVYLDREVFSRHRLRFTVVPVLMFAAFAFSPTYRKHGEPLTVIGAFGIVAMLVVLVQLLRRDTGDVDPPWPALLRGLVPVALIGAVLPMAGVGIDPGWLWLVAAGIASGMLDATWPKENGSRFGVLTFVAALTVALAVADVSVGLDKRFKPLDVLNLAAVVAGAWNLWHVLMQKYGIMRLYNAKSGNETKVPGWVDRLLIFSWMPFFLVWLGPTYRREVMRGFARGKKTLGPIIDLMEAAQPYLLVPSVVLIVAAIALFAYHERRANGLKNAPRLWLAAGTTLLSACFLFVHPVKVYLAYAFSHAVEYMVFVWAFQRRRYHQPLPHKPPLARVLKHPVLAYLGFVAVGGVIVVSLKYWGRTVFKEQDQLHFMGLPTSQWFLYWGVYQSMVHFYFDGFMWKMRRKSTRAHI